MLRNLIFLWVPLTFAQVPLYLRTPALASPVVAAAPVAQLQCAQQCMPSCLPSCLIAQSPTVNYQPYAQSVGTVAAAPVVAQPQVLAAAAPVASAYFQPYGTELAYYPVVASCAATCMPACEPACVATPSSAAPQRDDLPTPPPETMPTPPPVLQTLAPEPPTTDAPTDVVPCKCVIKITITQGGNTITKCGPNSCSCPKDYKQCGSYCCRK